MPSFRLLGGLPLCLGFTGLPRLSTTALEQSATLAGRPCNAHSLTYTSCLDLQSGRGRCTLPELSADYLR